MKLWKSPPRRWKRRSNTYGWTDDEFEIWWNKDWRFIERVHEWGWFRGTEKEKCLYEARIILEAAVGETSDLTDVELRQYEEEQSLMAEMDARRTP